jgi:Flp pilus assembly protein protease CpaA
MVAGFILLAVSLIFLGVASATDLRSREVADEISVAFLGTALAFRLVWSIVSGQPALFLEPFLVAVGFLVLGLAMYWLKQWGGGDVLVFTALGAAFGSLPTDLLSVFPRFSFFPFWVALLANVLLVGGAYGTVWIAWFFLSNQKVRRQTLEKLVKLWPISLFILVFSLLSFIFLFFPGNLLGVAFFPLYIVFLCSKSVESEIFVKKTLPKDLRVEDWIVSDVKAGGKVLVSASTSGLTKEDIIKIQRAKRAGKLDGHYILVKEGIPFIPVFFLALLTSILLGDPISLFFAPVLF